MSLTRKIPAALSSGIADIKTAIEKIVAELTPTLYTKTMTVADTEYSQVLPITTQYFTIKTRDGTPFRFAYETGKVATPTDPYATMVLDGVYNEKINQRAVAITLYFACSEAAKKVEIITWS